MIVNNLLNEQAHGMIDSIARKSAGQRTYIHRFFKTANAENAQGRALVAYHTNLNKLRGTDAFKQVPAVIEEEVKNVPEIKKEVDTFVRTLTENYPKSLDTRVSLASQDAVTINNVEPKSRTKKFMVTLNNFIKNALKEE